MTGATLDPTWQRLPQYGREGAPYPLSTSPVYSTGDGIQLTSTGRPGVVVAVAPCAGRWGYSVNLIPSTAGGGIYQEHELRPRERAAGAEPIPLGVPIRIEQPSLF